MMSPPSSKKQRRTHHHATTPVPATPQVSFLARMNQLKDIEYEGLNKKYTKLLEAVSNKNTFVNASMLTNTFPMAQNGKTDLLRQNMNEYARVARNIDLAYGTQYCGKVVGMGSNEGMQLMHYEGDEDDVDDTGDYVPNANIPPTFMSLLKREMRAISAGGVHSMALATNGTPYTWGASDKGALGTSTSVDEGNPSPVTGFYTTYLHPSNKNICEDGLIRQIAAGDVHSLFLSINGNVYQCGAYTDGDGSNFSDDDSKKVFADGDAKKETCISGFNSKPVHVYQLPRKAIAIYASKGYNAAILEDHSLVTWGEFLFFLYSNFLNILMQLF